VQLHPVPPKLSIVGERKHARLAPVSVFVCQAAGA
jgi:hypothetical protein